MLDSPVDRRGQTRQTVVVDLGRLAVDQPGEHEEDEEQRRRDRSQRQSDVADAGARLHPPADDPRRQPEHDEHDGSHVGPVGRQIGSAERGGQCRRTERQQRRIQRDAVHEHEPGGLESGAVAECILDPHEDSTTVRRGEFGRHEADGKQEQQRGQQVHGDRTEAETRRVGELGDAADAGHHQHRQCRPRDHRDRLDAAGCSRLGGGFFCAHQRVFSKGSRSFTALSKLSR